MCIKFFFLFLFILPFILLPFLPPFLLSLLNERNVYQQLTDWPVLWLKSRLTILSTEWRYDFWTCGLNWPTRLPWEKVGWKKKQHHCGNFLMLVGPIRSILGFKKKLYAQFFIDIEKKTLMPNYSQTCNIRTFWFARCIGNFFLIISNMLQFEFGLSIKIL